ADELALPVQAGDLRARAVLALLADLDLRALRAARALGRLRRGAGELALAVVAARLRASAVGARLADGDHRAITGRLALVAAAAGRVARLAGAGRVAELEHRGLRALGIIRRALRAGIAALLAGARLVARAARETADALAVHAIREGAGGAAVRAE